MLLHAPLGLLDGHQRWGEILCLSQCSQGYECSLVLLPVHDWRHLRKAIPAQLTLRLVAHLPHLPCRVSRAPASSNSAQSKSSAQPTCVPRRALRAEKREKNDGIADVRIVVD